MKKIFFITLFIIASKYGFAQKEKSKIEASIIGVFNGLSLVNADTLRYYTTSDFLLLENGQVWNMDTLINKIGSKKDPNFHRVNQFGFIKTVFKGSHAWISYFNTADIKMGEITNRIKWLESAVLVKEDGRWKIQMLHSTPIK